jgi:hypothetical protein
MEIPMTASPRSLRIVRLGLAAATCALTAALASAAPRDSDEHVGRDAERGDPARWYVPADTPRLKYQTRVKEAHAAAAEAIQECRRERAGRAACVADAKAQERSDLEEARRDFMGRRGER